MLQQRYRVVRHLGQDTDHPNYEGAPTDGSAWMGDSEFRVLRGGSWVDSADRLRSASRIRNLPNDPDGYFGFRVVMAAR
jgi:formylglycine-generating enzyme required for sulfatase activity